MLPNTLGYKSELQTDAEGVLHHLLTLDGMSRATLSRLLDRAQEFAEGPVSYTHLDVYKRQSCRGRSASAAARSPSFRRRSPSSALPPRRS